MDYFLPLDFRRRVLTSIRKTRRVLSGARIKAYIRDEFGVPSGYARDLNDQQLLMLLIWGTNQLLDLIPPIEQQEDDWCVVDQDLRSA